MQNDRDEWGERSALDVASDRTAQIAARFLGKNIAESEIYDPSLLLAIPRCENRRQYAIAEDQLPFAGYDVWHAYEFSTLTKKGVPVTRALKLKYRCDSRFLIESKSLKLYFNSFNMTRLGDTVAETLAIAKKLIERDLSRILQTVVELRFLEDNVERAEIFTEFQNLVAITDERSLSIDHFREAPELLKVDEQRQTDVSYEHYLYFDSLRSNCRVTHQPDFGDAFIYYKSRRVLDEGALVKYLTSFRGEFHFHEECCEMIFKRLSDRLGMADGDELLVCTLYTRRGGIDICPIRWSLNGKTNSQEEGDSDYQNRGELLAAKLLDLAVLARHGIKQ